MSDQLERDLARLRELLEQCGTENKILKIYIQQLKGEIKILKEQIKNK